MKILKFHFSNDFREYMKDLVVVIGMSFPHLKIVIFIIKIRKIKNSPRYIGKF